MIVLGMTTGNRQFAGWSVCVSPRGAEEGGKEEEEWVQPPILA